MKGRPEFVEIEVKSVLNRVTGMPFHWSINPYRGCAHGCVFCTSGDTPILMADATTRRLDELRIGNQIYGTERIGNFRRYVRTFVLAHWSVEKPAYQIKLEDGTELVAGEDHRFLSDRGWKFVIGSEQGLTRRPHLTVNNKLMGIGAFAMPPLKTLDYMRGYLSGIIRGDGTLRFYEYQRVGRTHGNQYHFRLALKDGEALQRAQTYLHRFSVATRNFVFQEASAGRSRMEAIRSGSRHSVEDIERLAHWPDDPSLGWCKGFLAGIFDAEGSYRGGILRISNTHPVILTFIERCLERLHFSFDTSLSERSGMKPIKQVTLRGGLREHLRFFHSVAPAITRKRNIEGQAIKNKSRLRVVAVRPLGLRRLFDITTGTGDYIANGVVSHNCYARRTHWFLEEDGVDRWSSKIFVKSNAPEVLRRELSRPSWKREEVALGTATDPYQAIEGRYKLTRRILEALADFRTPVSIVTRSPMIIRDRELLRDLARRAGVTVCVSVATTDAGLAREIEPGVAPPARRLWTVERLASSGIRAGVLLAPILPGLTDHPSSLEAVVRAARDHGAHFIGHRVLHLGEVTRDAFGRYLEQYHPELIPLYARMYRGKYAPAAYSAGIDRIVKTHKAQAQIVNARYAETPRAPEQLFLLPLPH